MANDLNPLNYSLQGSAQEGESKSIKVGESFDFGVDKQFSLGGLLGVPNEFKLDRFFGLEKSLHASAQIIDFRSRPLDVGVRIGTSPTDKVKAGIDVKAGASFGSISVKGGVSGEVSYETESGELTIAAAYVSPQIKTELPYAYAKVQPVFNLNVNPEIGYRVDPIDIPEVRVTVPEVRVPRVCKRIFGRERCIGGQLITPSFSKVIVPGRQFLYEGTARPIPGINIAPSLAPLVDLDTRRSGGQASYSQSLFGANLNLNLPSSASLSLSGTPNNALGAWKGGINGSVSLMDLNYDVTKLLPIPTNVSGNINLGVANIGGSLNLLTGTVGAKLDLKYGANAEIAPVLLIEAEGAGKKEIPSGAPLKISGAKDTNGDGKIDGSIELDYVFKGSLSASIDPKFSTRITALGASANYNINLAGVVSTSGGFSINPLIDLGYDLPLGSLNLLNISKEFRLSSAIGSQLKKTFSLPIQSQAPTTPTTTPTTTPVTIPAPTSSTALGAGLAVPQNENISSVSAKEIDSAILSATRYELLDGKVVEGDKIMLTARRQSENLNSKKTIKVFLIGQTDIIADPAYAEYTAVPIVFKPGQATSTVKIDTKDNSIFDGARFLEVVALEGDEDSVWSKSRAIIAISDDDIPQKVPGLNKISDASWAKYVDAYPESVGAEFKAQALSSDVLPENKLDKAAFGKRHYIQSGYSEGRVIPGIDDSASTFSDNYYKGDVAKRDGTIVSGSKGYEWDKYVSIYGLSLLDQARKDIVLDSVNPNSDRKASLANWAKWHYKHFGFEEGRTIDDNIDWSALVNVNPDLRAKARADIAKSPNSSLFKWGALRQRQVEEALGSSLQIGNENDEKIRNQYVYALGGDDLIVGTDGSDLLSGGEGNDIIIGRQVVDRITALGKSDLLYYNPQSEPDLEKFVRRGLEEIEDDVLGGPGRDTFVLAPGSRVRIKDFIKGLDQISIGSFDPGQLSVVDNHENVFLSSNIVDLATGNVLATVHGIGSGSLILSGNSYV